MAVSTAAKDVGQKKDVNVGNLLRKCTFCSSRLASTDQLSTVGAALNMFEYDHYIAKQRGTQNIDICIESRPWGRYKVPGPTPCNVLLAKQICSH